MRPLTHAAGGAARRWAGRTAWVSWLVAAVILTALTVQAATAWFGAAPAGANGAVIEIRNADFIAADATTLPPDDAGWQPTALPHRVDKPAGADLTGYWYQAGFGLPPAAPQSAPAPPLWLYLPRLAGGGSVFVNGALVGIMPSADPATHVRLLHPHLLMLPPSTLHAGVNRIALHFASREPRTSVSAFEIGPEQIVRARYERRLFIESTTAEISAAVCLMAGLGLLAFWLRRPQEHIYGLFALCLLFWGVRTLVMRWPVVPIAYLKEWRLAYYIAHCGFIVTISMFTLHFSHRRKPRFERFMVAYSIVGCLIFAIVGVPSRGVMDSYWQMPFFPFGMYCLAHLVVHASRQRARAGLAMGLALLLALGLAMHDFSVQEGWFHLSDIYLMHLGVPVFLLVMAVLLSERFLASLASAESANQRLAARVAEREQELALGYERLRQLERVYGATEERQRIMQDMHDGVGSQLLTTMAIVERGSASRSDTMALLQECLDDMRLAIDSLAPDQPDLLPALGNFRFRMQARLAAAGVALQWQNHALPESLELGTHTGLQVLRILQEALANVLKHAHASNVTVELHFGAQHLLIRVADDGIGFRQPDDRGGRGLANMGRRAEQIGAMLTIEAPAAGCALHLTLPLPPISMTAAAMAPAKAPAGAAVPAARGLLQP